MGGRISYQLLFPALLLTACLEPKVPDVLVNYYVENRVRTTVHVTASTHLGQTSLRTDSVQPAGTELILDVMEGGGVLLPSDFLHSFVVTTTDSLGGTDTLYNAVNDSDWHRSSITTNRASVVFVVE